MLIRALLPTPQPLLPSSLILSYLSLSVISPSIPCVCEGCKDEVPATRGTSRRGFGGSRWSHGRGGGVPGGDRHRAERVRVLLPAGERACPCESRECRVCVCS